MTIKFDRESLIFLKNSKWLLSSNLVNATLTFVKSILIARGLGVDMFGVYVILTTFVLLVQEFFDLQIGSAIIKFGAGYRAQQEKGALINLIHSSYILSMIMALSSIFAVPLILQLWHQPFIEIPGLVPYILLLAVCSGFGLLDRPCVAILQLHSRFKVNAMVNTGIAAADLIIVAFTLLIWPSSLTALLVAASIILIIKTFILNVSMFFELGREMTFFANFSLSQVILEIKRIWGFVIGTSGSNTLKKIINRGDVLLLATLSGATQVGFYAIAKKIASVIKIVTDPLALTIYPQLATLVAEKKLKQLNLMIRKVSGFIFVPCVFIILILLFFGEKIISLAYGFQYARAVHALLFVMLATSIEATLFWSISLLNSLNLVAVRFYIYLVSGIMGLCIALALTPPLGAVGMAITVLCVSAFIHGMFVFASTKKVRTLQAR